MPGAFFHLQAKTVTLPEMYQIHLVYWVDPETGALLNVNENEQVTLPEPSRTGSTVAVPVRLPAWLLVYARLPPWRPRWSALFSRQPQASWPGLGTRSPADPRPRIAGALALIAGLVLLVRKPRQNTDAQRSSSRAASSR